MTIVLYNEHKNPCDNRMIVDFAESPEGARKLMIYMSRFTSVWEWCRFELHD